MRNYTRRADKAVATTSFRITQEELALLDEYADEKGMSRSAVLLKEIRKLLKRAGKLPKGG